MKRCLNHGSLGCGNLQPLDCKTCSVIARENSVKNTKSRPTVTHITIERNPPYIVTVQGDAGARNGAYEYSELFGDLASARAYVNSESDKLVKENKKNVVRKVENL